MPERSDSSYNLGMAPSDVNSGHSAAGRCQLCGRLLGEERLTRHHLLPRSRSRKMKRRRKGRQELKRRDPGRTVALCGPCHRNVHVSIGNTDLARGYDSVEALSEHPGVRRFTEWVKDKPHGRAGAIARRPLESYAPIARLSDGGYCPVLRPEMRFPSAIANMWIV
jgi:hypothetical protein